MRIHKKNCQCASCKSIRGEYSKENHPCWKGKKHVCSNCGVKISFYANRCQKCAFIKELNGNYNDGRTLKKYYCEDCGKEITHNTVLYLKNNKCSSCARKGDLNSNWKDGEGYIPYPIEFNEQLKESIRKRDNYECKNCSMIEEEHIILVGQVLHVHHIDYDKTNCKEDNLITTCRWCNTRANANRDYWQEIYTNKMENLLKEIGGK